MKRKVIVYSKTVTHRYLKSDSALTQLNLRSILWHFATYNWVSQYQTFILQWIMITKAFQQNPYKSTVFTPFYPTCVLHTLYVYPFNWTCSAAIRHTTAPVMHPVLSLLMSCLVLVHRSNPSLFLTVACMQNYFTTLKVKRLDACYSAAYFEPDSRNSSTLQSQKWQLIGMS